MACNQSQRHSSLYFGRAMAAPMVRVSTLAFRQLCAHHGADVVFTEEIVAAKLMKCGRRFLPQVAVEADAHAAALPPHLATLLAAVLLPPTGVAETSAARGDGAGDGGGDTAGAAAAIRRWMGMLPFIRSLLVAGRVEVVYRGHGGEQPANSKGPPRAADDGDANEGDDPGSTGEVVFATLGKSARPPTAAVGSGAVGLAPDDACAPHAAAGAHAAAAIGAVEQQDDEARESQRGMPLFFTRTEGLAGTTLLIGQIGASDPTIAVAGFDLLAPFVSGADVNMGCPKAFSIKAGMGAALMANRDKGAAILGALARSFPHTSISYKTRLFEDLALSVAHVRACFEATGRRLHAVTMHGRYRPQRSETAPQYAQAAALAAMLRGDADLRQLCLIFNGSIALRAVPTVASTATATTTTTPTMTTTPTSAAAAAAALDAIAFSGKADPVAAAAAGVAEDSREIDALMTPHLAGAGNMLAAARRVGFDGVLVARGAMWRPSLFAPPCEAWFDSIELLSSSPPPSSSSSTSDTATTAAAPASSNYLLEFVLREFQALLVAYAAAGDNLRLFKYHVTRAVPEYQQAEYCKGGDAANKSTAAAMTRLFGSLRDSRTMPEFARALRFSDSETAALCWMAELVAWRRAGTAVWDTRPVGMAVHRPPKRRQREDGGDVGDVDG